MNNNIGVVLSGGGVKGVGHLAFLEALVQKSLRPDIISCTSAGALIGAMYASGQTREVILDFFKESPLTKLSYLSRTKPGLFDSKKYIKLIKEFVPATFEELEIPIIITATNLQTGAATYFSKGDLYGPLIASCAVPLVFSPVRIEDTLYIDGGAADNFPIKPLINKNVRILGSYVSTTNVIDQNEMKSGFRVAQRANSILLDNCNNYKFQFTEQTICFPIGHFGLFDTNKAEEIYNYCKSYIDKQQGFDR